LQHKSNKPTLEFAYATIILIESQQKLLPSKDYHRQSHNIAFAVEQTLELSFQL